jgi:hypothetical protein
MLTAIRQSDGLKVAGDEIEKDLNEIYICDYCETELIHNKSDFKIKIGHFKHKSGHLFCPNNTNETEWHYKSKLDIQKYIKSKWNSHLNRIGIEVWLANKTIRADVFLETKKGSKIAVEVQASILQVAEIKKRTEKYRKEGIYVLWVIPFDYHRFNELKKSYGWVNNQWTVTEESWGYRDSVRLKEYELFLYWCYFKQVFAWDLTHEHSDNFIILKLDECKTMVNSFYKDGEEITVGGNATKTTKEVKGIYVRIPFDKLTTSNAKEFEIKQRNYVIPERKTTVNMVLAKVRLLY